MDPSIISAARALLPDNAIYADWAASALPLPVSTSPCFIPPAHNADHPDIDKARRALQAFLHDTHDRYHVIFTSGATAALRILSDRLPWSCRDALFCHAHVHNAVLGIRNPASSAGAHFRSVRSDELERELEEDRELENCVNESESDQDNLTPFALLAYPGQCNLTGTTYPFTWARRAKRQGLFSYPPHQVITLLDTAKLAASAPFSLDNHNTYLDAVVFSLYKLSASFTGLGALLVRKGSLLEQLLRSTAARSYFAGGRTVDAISPFSSVLFVPSGNLQKQLELGTPNLQAIRHLPAQLSFFSPAEKVMADIHDHTSAIAASFSRSLIEAFSPENIKIHSDDLLQGAECGRTIVAFTLYRTDGTSSMRYPIGHNEIGTILKINNVYARAGCMCNTGACCAVLGLSDTDVTANYAKGHRCGDDMDLIHGKPTGVVRMSFGWASLPRDSDSIVHILRNHVCVSVQRGFFYVAPHGRERRQHFVVDSLYVYPVKSCAGASVRKFTIDEHGGALGDRRYAIEDIGSTVLLTLRSCPALANLSARYSNNGSRLILELEGNDLGRGLCAQKNVDITTSEADSERDSLCVDRPGRKEEDALSPVPDLVPVRTTIGGGDVSDWLSVIIGKPVRLVRQNPHEGRCEIGSDVLVVSKDEMDVLKTESGIDNMTVLHAALRPNIILGRAYESNAEQRQEPISLDAFKSFQMDTVHMLVRRGCTRCAVVNIVARAHGFDVQGEPLRSIARISRQNGQKGLVFGAIATINCPGHSVGMDQGSLLSPPVCVKVSQDVVGKFNEVVTESVSVHEYSTQGSVSGQLSLRRISPNNHKTIAIT